MKKETVFTILAIVLNTIIIILWVFLYRSTQSNNNLRLFGENMINSYSNAVSYIICDTDMGLGNVDFSACKWYLDEVVETTKVLKDNINMKMEYKYIGKN